MKIYIVSGVHVPNEDDSMDSYRDVPLKAFYSLQEASQYILDCLHMNPHSDFNFYSTMTLELVDSYRDLQTRGTRKNIYEDWLIDNTKDWSGL